jgi:hypothetical protein
MHDGRRDMEVWSEAAYSAAYRILWQAEGLAGMRYPHPGRRALVSVPAHITAALLMSKAGVPTPLIATVSGVAPGRLRRRLAVATALLIFPPYAARIEGLMRDMQHFGTIRQAGAPAKEAPCAAQPIG